MKNLKIYIIAVNVLFIIAALSSCSENLSPADRYAKEHQDKSFELVMQNSETFTKESLKDDVSALKKRIAGLKKSNKGKSNNKALVAQLEELRKQIEELENQ